MKPLNYVKPASCEKLFKKFDRNGLTAVQNYNPLYNVFFALSAQNWNTIHLNHRHHVCDFGRVVGAEEETHCVLVDATLTEISATKGKGGGRSDNSIKKNVFVKVSPLLNPLHYLSGVFPIERLETITRHMPRAFADMSAIGTHEKKMYDVNNAAYTDSFFTFLSSQLVDGFHFINGLQFYGSFVGVKHNFMCNVADDLEYLLETDFFTSQKDKLFSVEDYSEFFEEKVVSVLPQPRLTVLESENVDLILDDDADDSNCKTMEVIVNNKNEGETEVMINVDDCENNNDVVKLNRMRASSSCSSSSGSSCSSCSSHSSNNSVGANDGCAVVVGETKHNDEGDDDDSADDELPDIYATIPHFPVQLICMEECCETLDDYLSSKGFGRGISNAEWFAILMQIIMTLIVYQKTFHFTHNDLHTNNIMYVQTNKKHVFYRYGGSLYRVPTYGRIYKIIDFGRAIFDYRGVRFCSDHFQRHGDAYSQYNTEPYFEADKPRLDPNYSFDLCRLACTLFDDLHQLRDDGEGSNADGGVDMRRLMEKVHARSPVAKLIADWCTGDDGKNVLYKNNGEERYPDFKLYKMIARRVNRHTPVAQLERPEFSAFRCSAGFVVPKGMPLINIDAMGDYSGAEIA